MSPTFRSDGKSNQQLQIVAFRMVKRTGENDWYVPKRQPFHMTTQAERLKLFRKMFLGLPFRKIRLSLRRRKHRIANGG